MKEQLKLIAEEMTEDGINEMIDKYKKACDLDEEKMESDGSEFWYNDYNLNERLLYNYLELLKIKQGNI